MTTISEMISSVVFEHTDGLAILGSRSARVREVENDGFQMLVIINMICT